MVEVLFVFCVCRYIDALDEIGVVDLNNSSFFGIFNNIYFSRKGKING